MDASCASFSHYMAEFRRAFEQAIAEHKWYMSEKAGHDVGYTTAVSDFLNSHFDRFAGDVRLSFCRTQCRSVEDCRIAVFVEAIPSVAQTLGAHERSHRRLAS